MWRKKDLKTENEYLRKENNRMRKILDETEKYREDLIKSVNELKKLKEEYARHIDSYSRLEKELKKEANRLLKR